MTLSKGIGLVVFSPLAQGMLTGKYDDGIPVDSRMANLPQFKTNILTDVNAGKVRALAPIAEELGISRAQLALAWLLHQPSVSSVITGATKVSQIEENVAAVDVELTAETLAAIETALG